MSELRVHAGLWLLNINVYFQSSYRFKTRAKIQQSGVWQSFTIFRNNSNAGWVRKEWRGAEAFFWAHGSQFRGALGLHHHRVMIDSRGLLLPLAVLEISCTCPKHLHLCEWNEKIRWMKCWCLSVPCSVVSCKVDASKLEGTSLHIKKLRPSSDCEMKLNSVPKDEITVSSDGDLSFQDCLPEDIQVTATRSIGKSRFMRVADVGQLQLCVCMRWSLNYFFNIP